jgi:cell division protein FtsB
MAFLPPTSDFPPDPEPLSREDLNSIYLELRNCYKSSMISRGQFRSRSIKARDETALLKQSLLELAAREASVRTDIYHLEDAGDDIVNEFGRYKLGRKTYQGGSFLGGLVQAVIRFINRWTHTKERVVQLDQKRQEFIEKTKDLPPFALGGNGHNGPMNQPEPSVPANVENEDSAAAQQVEEVKADGTTH